jgi:hypothetical protein
MTMAVEDMERARPQAREACQEKPRRRNAPEHRRVVPPSWIAPVPRMSRRIRQKEAGFQFQTMRKSIMTTPNSAKWRMSLPSSPTKPRQNGPMAIPPMSSPKRSHAQLFCQRTKTMAAAR